MPVFTVFSFDKSFVELDYPSHQLSVNTRDRWRLAFLKVKNCVKYGSYSYHFDHLYRLYLKCRIKIVIISETREKSRINQNSKSIIFCSHRHDSCSILSGKHHCTGIAAWRLQKPVN